VEGGGVEVSILMMSLGIVPKIPCRRIFVLSNPGVPRTFIADCSLVFQAIAGRSDRKDFCSLRYLNYGVFFFFYL